jgi:hypothetical protein
MMISCQPRSLFWKHPDFDLIHLYTHWCGYPYPPAPVQGHWLLDWIAGDGDSVTWAALLGTNPLGGRDGRVWVGTAKVAELLRQHGYTNVQVLGMPVVYVPEALGVREPSSLLLLLNAAPPERVGWMRRVGELGEKLLAPETQLRRITVCLPPQWYIEEREWIWQLRLAGIEVVLFEENPLSVESLREAAALFASYEFVSGNNPGHWTAHAALRGAKVSILSSSANQKPETIKDPLYPDAFYCAPLSAEPAIDWARGELGVSERLSAEVMAQTFGWPVSAAANEPRSIRLAISGTLELGPQQVYEEACAEGKSAIYQAFVESRLETGPIDFGRTLSLALFRLSAGKPFQAARMLEGVIRDNYRYVPCVVLLVDILRALKRYKEAGELLSRAIGVNPDHPGLFLCTGRLMEVTSGVEIARELFGIGLGLAKDHSSGLIWPQASTGSGSGRMLLVSCTAKSEDEQDTLMIVQSFRKNLSGSGRKIDLDVVFSNTRGLPEVYNQKLEEAAALGYEFLCFVHDDVHIDDCNLEEKVRRGYRDFGFHISGIAGTSKPRVVYPTLWHRMSEPEDYRGFVFNCSPDGNVLEITRFGSSPAPVDLLDGVFMAAHLPSAMAVGWKFNESFQFHHYDLAASIDAKRKGLQLGVVPIHLVHMSPGLWSLENPGWLSSNSVFLELYGDAEGQVASGTEPGGNSPDVGEI